MSWFIHIEDCCGCGACAQICPNGCIDMSEDAQGFLVPHKDTHACVNCGQCESVCPVLNINQRPSRDVTYYICKNIDRNILEKSSSGGVFDAMSKYVIDQGGVVFGVRFDDQWGAYYHYAETIEDAEQFRGSKYEAASVGDTYNQTLSFLNAGRLVLFSGTPCHIAGLHHFLQKDYENLITVDVICHAVPSPKVWRAYLREVSQVKEVTGVTFRSKAFGWDRYGLKIEGKNGVLLHEPNDKNLYMQGFLSGLTIRSCCEHCAAKNFSSRSDITIGDYWELPEQYPDMNDNRGMSLVVVSTHKGETMLQAIKQNLMIQQIQESEVDFVDVHTSLVRSVSLHPNRAMFFEQLAKNPNKVSKAIRYNLKEHLTTKERFVRVLKVLCGNQYYTLRKLWKRK